VNPGSPLKAIIPEDHWGIRFLHILPDSFFEETNVEFRLIGSRSSFFQRSEGCANVIAEFLTSLDICSPGMSAMKASGAPISLAKCFMAWSTFPRHKVLKGEVAFSFPDSRVQQLLLSLDFSLPRVSASKLAD
jgi:hypothetical protein